MKLIALISILTTAVFAQGPLTPPGAPAPTMKTLDEIHSKVADVGERRTPISSLPFTISASGSYYLTGNLSVASGDGITVLASHVTIDLNGFSLTGGAANGNGIYTEAAENVRILNGRLRYWQRGIVFFAANRGSVEMVTVVYCVSGVFQSLGSGLEVRKSIVADCSGNAIVAQGTSIIEDNTVRNNNGSGIRIEGNNSEVRGNTVSQNAVGVEVLYNDVCVDSNTLKYNFYGLRIVNSGNSVRRNTLRANSNPNIIFAGNDVAPFQTAAAATSPFANISY